MEKEKKKVPASICDKHGTYFPLPTEALSSGEESVSCPVCGLDEKDKDIETLRGLIDEFEKETEDRIKEGRAKDKEIEDARRQTLEWTKKAKSEGELLDQALKEIEELKEKAHDFRGKYLKEREEKEKWKTGYEDRVVERDRAEQEKKALEERLMKVHEEDAMDLFDAGQKVIKERDEKIKALEEKVRVAHKDVSEALSKYIPISEEELVVLLNDLLVKLEAPDKGAEDKGGKIETICPECQETQMDYDVGDICPECGLMALIPTDPTKDKEEEHKS